ncbi:MAG: carboxymuconolactone decarboxylase family protein [Gemmatimonadaceae bacterium]|nr:carboxymuconolactone decarboxylase family protein [Gemmatimonadaceae bacterium]
MSETAPVADARETAAARSNDPTRVDSMTHDAAAGITLSVWDAETAALVTLAALLAGGSEAQVREQLAVAAAGVRPEWVEEVILQTYLFAGFPRALNAAREWRRISGRPAPDVDPHAIDEPARRRTEGEATCATVYGRFYDRLRVNIRDLHPALDQWMIEEGYGKVLSRTPLDLARRELCIVAACAIARQDRQLHSHLHGALHAGAAPAVVSAALDAVAPFLEQDEVKRAHGLWARVLGK